MNKVIVILGPTGVGKTKMSIELAKRLDGEIVNADSMQFYKNLDIGTAKIKEEEKENIPHHLFDIKEVSDDYSIFDYQKDGRKRISDILNRKKTPIIVGGTGLYIKALLYNYKLIEALDDRTGFHEKYLINNIESIKNLCSIANAMARKQLTSTKNYAFAFYSHNFICDGESYVVGLEKSAWRDSLQNQFMQCLKASEGNSDKLAKNLNIDKELAIEIIKDQEALSKINSTDNVNQKYQIFDNRMREKLNTHVKVLSEDWFEGKNEYRNLRTRFYGYLTFAIKANKLGIKYDPDRLNKNFEKELKNLCKKIDEKAEDRNLGNVLQDNQIQDFLDNNYILQ